MKFFCEYCGNRIDAEVDRKCPNCGASYKKNKTFIKLEESRTKEKELNQEYKNKIINHAFDFLKFSKWFSIVPVIIFIVVLSIFVVIFMNVNKKTNSMEDKFQNNTHSMIESIFNSDTTKDQNSDDKDITNKEVIVNLDEYGLTDKYKVKVTKYEVVEDKFNRIEKDYELVKFYLVVENISGKQLTKEDVNCIVDGIAQTNDFTSGYSDLPMFIKKDLTVKGTATFEVPKNTTSYDIKYGDYVTIHIEK